ncbi:cytochrome b [Nocardioides sp. LHG3406-4]|uniref:cytochrome b n=1 Tax=Nocardioides sp. LHG3406-4 TaxID=2804575 RepID=UPI003CF50F0E
MGLRSGEHGYGAVTKVLHWATVVALGVQFTVGYFMDVDDSGHGRGRGRGRGGDSGRGRGRGGDDDEGLTGIADRLSDPLVAVHVVLGLTILLLAVLRMTWRKLDALPPWAEGLSHRERRLAHVTERVLLAMLVLMPLTGISVLLGDDDLLWLHVGSHVVFFAALAAHLGLVAKHTLVDRDGLLGRML